MNHLLLHYQRVEPTTWAYLSSLLMIALFFKFNRVWSVRNIDLLLLILLAPGLLLVDNAQRKQVALRREATGLAQRVQRLDGSNSTVSDRRGDATFGDSDVADSEGNRTVEADLAALTEQHDEWRGNERRGYLWLLTVEVILLVRLLFDPTMVRRPMLDPNLSTGGLIFICCSLFVFVMANVLTSIPTEGDLHGPKAAAQLLVRDSAGPQDDLSRHGPGYAVLTLLPSLPTMSLHNQPNAQEGMDVYSAAARVMAILSHFAVVIGVIGIGYRHFDNIKTGIGAAAIYLMLPYTTIWTGRIEHVLPAALMVWAVLCYRRPWLSGMCIGSAIGVVYYPLFLLPLWFSFYWQRGVGRFLLGAIVSLSIMTASLLFVSPDLTTFWLNVQKMFGLWLPVQQGLEGIWGLGWDPVYRIPVLVAFVALSCTLAMWPSQKNLGTLLSCSSAVMVAVQFWHGYGGGLFVAWYLPLALLTVFRPNLEDRVALAVLTESWFPLYRRRGPRLSRAA